MPSVYVLRLVPERLARLQQRDLIEKVHLQLRIHRHGLAGLETGPVGVHPTVESARGVLTDELFQALMQASDEQVNGAYQIHVDVFDSCQQCEGRVEHENAVLHVFRIRGGLSFGLLVNA